MIQRLRIFTHHIYELQKGLRQLILFTASREDLRIIVGKLKSKHIAYVILSAAEGSDRVNVFFGHASCVDVIRMFKRKRLSDFTPEQDFILGIMLGYDRVMQCERYLRRKGRWQRAAARSRPPPRRKAGLPSEGKGCSGGDPAAGEES